MKTNEKEKLYLSYIKSADTAITVAFVLNLVYVVRFILSRNFDFFFSLYTTQFALKGGGFFGIYEGSISKSLSVIIVALSFLVLLAALLLPLKNPSFLTFSLIAYSLDTAFLIFGFIKNPFFDINEGSYIDLIFHLFILLFIFVGIYANNKLKNSEQTK